MSAIVQHDLEVLSNLRDSQKATRWRGLVEQHADASRLSQRLSVTDVFFKTCALSRTTIDTIKTSISYI